MNESLAERIRKNTIKVVAEREAKIKTQNRMNVLTALTKYFHDKSCNGEKIFTDALDSEFDFDFGSVDGMSRDEVKETLKDMGLEIHRYHFRELVAIPKGNIPNEILGLIEIYNENMKKFIEREEELAQRDIESVLKLLDEGKYEVVYINQIKVEFSSQSESEQYVKYVKEAMKKNNLECSILRKGYWSISIPERGN